MSMLLHLRATVYGREIRHISTLLHGCSYNTPRMGPYRISAKILNGLFLDVTGRGLRKLTPHCNVFSVVLKHPSANRQLPWLLLSCAAKMFIISRNRLCLFGRSQYWVCWTSPWQIETNLHFAFSTFRAITKEQNNAYYFVCHVPLRKLPRRCRSCCAWDFEVVFEVWTRSLPHTACWRISMLLTDYDRLS